MYDIYEEGKGEEGKSKREVEKARQSLVYQTFTYFVCAVLPVCPPFPAARRPRVAWPDVSEQRGPFPRSRPDCSPAGNYLSVLNQESHKKTISRKGMLSHSIPFFKFRKCNFFTNIM